MRCCPTSERALLAGYIVNKFRGDVAAVRRRHRGDRRAHRAALASASCRSSPRPRLLPAEDSLALARRPDPRSPRTASEGPRSGRVRASADPHRRAGAAAHRQFRRSRPAARRAGRRAGHGPARAAAAARCGPGDPAGLEGDDRRSRLRCAARAGTSTSSRIAATAGGSSASAAAIRCSGGRIADPVGHRGRAGRRRRGSGCSTSTPCSAPKSGCDRSRGVDLASGAPVAGYEMHLGRTTGPGLARPMLRLGGRGDGAVSADGRVAGCYLHGLFASDPFRRAFLARLGAAAGDARLRAAQSRPRSTRSPIISKRHLDLAALLAAARPPRLQLEQAEMARRARRPAPGRPAIRQASR